MITGFNTDIEFQGTTYHVQTEDKGVKTPLILSLVYDRGTILASKRSPYNDLLIGNFDEKILAERLQKQHNLICAAVRTGRIEDLKRMAAKESTLKQKTKIVENGNESQPESKALSTENTPGEKVKTDKPEIFNQTSFQEKIKSFDRPQVENSPNDWSGSLPIAIHDYGAGETIADTKLKVRLLSEQKFKSGDAKTLRVLVNRGNSSKGLRGIQVITKILGSAFTPLVFHTKTDDYGIATVELQLPHFKSGRAAILIKAMTEGEEADLRRAITHG